MVQSIQSSLFGIHPVASWIQKNQDGICVLPTGAAWFDLFSWQEVLDPDKLTVVVYPSQRMLQNHSLRLALNGCEAGDFEVLTSDLPPHAERALWDRLVEGKTRLLLITGKKLQSVQTLSQLVRHPNLGPVIINDGHLALPYLWGPASTLYESLSDFFREQWQGHPALIMFTNFLPDHLVTELGKTFALSHPYRYNALPSFENLRFTVSRHVTQHQKLNALKNIVRIKNAENPCKTFILSRSVKMIHTLEKHMKSFRPILIHHQLENDDLQCRLIDVLHEPEVVALVDATLLPEIPMHLFFPDNFRIIHWDMPWSLEDLVQQTALATRYSATPFESIMLYTKEDFERQKRWLGHYFSEASGYQSIALEHLNHVRQFLRKQTTCRMIQLGSLLHNSWANAQPCRRCDVCRSRSFSSRWMNVLDPFLY